MFIPHSSFIKTVFEKISSFLKIAFLVLSVFLFSSVSVLSKFFLIFILFFLFLTFLIFYPKEKNIIFPPQILFFTIIFFLYLLFNTYFVSSIKFESKQEILNYNLYFLTFFIFNFFKNDKIFVDLNISFLIIQTVLFTLFMIKNEYFIYFFNYNPNILSGYCLMVTLFSFYSFYKQPEGKNIYYIQIFNFLLSALFLFLLKNFSSIFIVISFLLFTYNKKIFLNIIILLCLITLGIVENFDSFFNRILWMIVGYKVFIEHFFLGTGLNTFKLFYQQYVNDIAPPTIATIFVHNYFLHLASEIGFIGLMFIIAIVFYIIKRKVLLNEKKLFYPLLGILIQNLIDYNLLIPQNSILFSIFLSYVIGIKNYFKKENLYKVFNVMTYIVIISLFFQGFFLNSKLQQIDFLLKSFNKKDLKRVVEIEKTCWYGWKMRAIMELKENNINLAEKFFLETIKYNPRDAESFIYLSLINFKFNRKKEGYKFFIESIKLNPKAAYKYKKLVEDIL